MYNRYIPQPDGSYRRNRMAEPTQSPNMQKPPPEPFVNAPEMQECPPAPVRNPQHSGVGSFLKQLFPKDFDTGDLIIILLLLLMVGDSEEDRNSAILTLALYFMM